MRANWTSRALQLLLVFSVIAAVAFAQNPYVPPPPDPTEAAKVQAIWDNISDLMNKEHAKGNPWLRMAHAKQHGCVRATIETLPNLTPVAAQGLFNPATQNNTHFAIIRFSNGIARGFTAGFKANESDAIPDTRGFAIKIFGVNGPKILSGFENAETLDFTFITTRSQFVDTIDNALGFFSAVHDGLLSESHWLATHPSFALRFAKLTIDGGGVTDLLKQTYWSESPHMHGTTAAKYSVRPCQTAEAQSTSEKRSIFDHNFLRTNLQKSLSQSGACFVLSAQFYVNEKTTPVEDSTIDWPTPNVDLARIMIPAQSFGTTGQEDFCRWMSYNPFHTIAEHTPIGVVQRIRRLTYTNAAAQRHALQGQANVEPTTKDYYRYPSL